MVKPARVLRHRFRRIVRPDFDCQSECKHHEVSPPGELFTTEYVTMGNVTAHYNRDYIDQKFAELLQDDALYQLRSQCAARTYFGDLTESSARVLEYGCGIGQSIASLPQAVGFDVNFEALQECRRHGVAVTDRPEDIPRNYFDRVLCRHVLEHVENPLATLRELLAYLAPGGQLVLVLPKEPHGRVSLKPDINRHLFSWNFRCINNLVHAAGGKPITNEYHPMFGPRSDYFLRPLYRWAGLAAYYHTGRLVGRILNQFEMVIRVTRCEETGSPGVTGAGRTQETN